MDLKAADPTITLQHPERELDLLIREARRRQRRRRRAIVLALVLAVAGAYVGARVAGSAPRPGSLLARRLRLPSLGPGGRCPVSSGYTLRHNPYFDGDVLGRGPVRVLIANWGDVVHGRPGLGTTAAHGWSALQTLWFAMPGYNGPFVVRGARLGKPGPIEVQPDGDGQSPGSGPLAVHAGPAINSFPPPGLGTYRGYRTVPGSTWVKSPGCYAWQVDGRGFSEVVVFDAVRHAPLRRP